MLSYFYSDFNFILSYCYFDFSGVNSVEFMAAVSEQSRALESSLRELRSDLSDPIRVNELGQEV